jgi:hypothetical protein
MTKREQPSIDPELIHALRADAASGPGAGVQARVFARIENQLAALAVPAAAATATVAAKSAAAAPSAVLVPNAAPAAVSSLLVSALSKPIGIALVSAAVGGAGTYVLTEHTQPIESSGDHTATAPAPVTARPVAQVPRAISPPLPAQPPEAARPSPTSRNEITRRPVRASALPPNPKPAPAPSTTLPSAPGSLGEQQALLDAARKALARGESRAVLETLSAHSSRYPNSDLVEEREALAIKALVAAGQYAAARERSARFQHRFPNSLLGPSVAASLRAIP